ncbi:MAG: hypothetical protein RL235_405 [Chlamydiota bacterium]|jgi:hypothetical protein
MHWKKRTPRNYDGNATTTKILKDLLPPMLVEMGRHSTDVSQPVFEAWGRLLGAERAALAEPIALTDGVLIVKVKSTMLHSVLKQYEKERLLRALQEQFPVRNIAFRMG